MEGRLARDELEATIPAALPVEARVEAASIPSVGVPHFLTGGGETGALMRSIDWATTPLGPVDQWPQSLRTTVSTCLNSRFPILVWWGPELIKLYNDAYATILGAKHPKALGQRGRECWAEIWHIIGPMLEGVMQRGEATWSHDQMLPLHRHGYTEECYFTFTYSPIRDETGGVGGVFCAVIETTARVLSERRLATLRELGERTAAETRTPDEACRAAAKTLAANSADLPFALIYLLDADGRNARLAGVSGYGPHDAASPARIDLSTDDATAPWPMSEVARSGRARLIDDVGARVPALPGGLWPEAVTRALVLPIARPGQDQRPWGVLVAGISPRRELDDSYRGFFDLVAGQIATAVSNAHAYEEERKRAEALAALDHAKTAFFSNVSHEFRTPLTLILGPAEDALGTSALPPDERERMEIIHRNALRLLKLVNNLLDFSRIEAGRARAALEPTDLAAFTADVASSFRSAIERAGLRFVVDCPPLSRHVLVDREMWEKVVLNLLSNAFKHTFEGEITVSVRASGSVAELEVRDTGIGIPEDELPHVFDRFHRIAGARGRTHEGSGIGLALVQEIVRLHGGEVSVASTVGVGSVFTVRLPAGAERDVAQAAPASEEGEAERPSRLAAESYIEEALGWLPQAPDGAPDDARVAVEEAQQTATTVAGMSGRVLLADDNADMREYASRLLRSAGFEVETVADGLEALEAVHRAPPDLVLSDVMMPGVDGFALLHELRANSRTRGIPVILLSARAGEDARIEGLGAGADDYLVKPFVARELVARVGTQVTLARTRAQAAGALRHARDFLMGVFAQAPVAICVLKGRDHVFELANPFYERLVGARTLIGRAVRDAIPEAQAQGFVALLDEVYSTGVPYVGKGIPLSYDRSGQGRVEEVYLNFLYYPFRDAYGTIIGVIGIGTEVTDEVRARREAEEAKRTADAANRTKSDFLAAMSHELRTPLNAIAGYVQLVEMGVHGPVTPAQHEALGRIRRSQQHLLALINDVLNFAKLEAGRVEYEIREVALAQVVADVSAMMEPQFTARGLRFEARVSPSAFALADPEKVHQIVLNLLSNAAKFTERGGRVTVETVQREGAPAGMVFLRVADTGIGIRRDKQDLIFDPFVQVHRNLTSPGEGTGLGLAISRDLARGMGGDLRVRSTEGLGATFTLSLRAAPRA